MLRVFLGIVEVLIVEVMVEGFYVGCICLIIVDILVMCGVVIFVLLIIDYFWFVWKSFWFNFKLKYEYKFRKELVKVLWK